MRMWKKNKMGITAVLLVIGVLLPVAVLAGCSKKAEKSGVDSQGGISENVETTEKVPLVSESIPKFSEDDVKGLKVEKDGKVLYSLDYEPKEDREPYLFWDIKVPYDSYVIVDTEAVYGMFKTFADIDWEKAEIESDGGNTMGEVDTGISTSSTKITIEYGADTLKEAVVIVGNESKDNKYYCAMENSRNKIFSVETFKIDSILNRTPYDLILKIPYLVDIRTVDKVDISLYGKKKVKLTQSKDAYKINKKKVTKEQYQELYQSILQPTITGEIPGEERSSLDGEELLALYFHRNLEGAEDYDVKIYAYDGVKDYVSVNGNTFFFVEKDEVDQILEQISNIR